MLTTLADLVQRAADALFVPWLLVLLFGTGLFLTIRYRFVQVRRFGEAFRAMLSSAESGSTGALSPFQAFMTALSGTIGTGNIAGVATAIVSGGPGALFWIWAYGFVATTIKFTEAVLGVTWRESVGTTIRSGPMYCLARRSQAAVAGHHLRGWSPAWRPSRRRRSRSPIPSRWCSTASSDSRRGSPVSRLPCSSGWSSSAASGRSARPPRSWRPSRSRCISVAG